MSLEDTFAVGRKFLSRSKKSSRAAFSMATLVINVLPWDPAHHPSGVPSHFVPFEFVLEEVLPFLPTESLVVKEVSVMAGALVDCVTFSYVDVDGLPVPPKDFGQKGGNLHPESFVLGDEEYINEVSFHHGNAWGSHSLFAVRFVTNQGRSSLSYGNEKGPDNVGGPASTFKAKPGHQITGLVRQGWGFCPTVTGIVEMPLDPDLTQLSQVFPGEFEDQPDVHVTDTSSSDGY